MQDLRRHKRYRLDLIEVTGKMSLTTKVEVLDISLGGVALKADQRLNIGREYLIKLEEKGKTLDVRGTIVRSELVGIEERNNGERVSIYTAGMTFKEGSAAKVADFLKPIEQQRKETARQGEDQRLHVRFNIITPRDKVLSYPAQFRVKSISLSGMLIQAEQALTMESKIPMSLSLGPDNAVKFVGRVAVCRLVEDAEPQYEIGVEFTDLTDGDKALIKAFTEYLATVQAQSERAKS